LFRVENRWCVHSLGLWNYEESLP